MYGLGGGGLTLPLHSVSHLCVVVAGLCCGINVKSVISLGVECTDERGVLCGCGLCVVETTVCGLVYVKCHYIISCCRVTSIDYGGMVQLSVK